MGIYLADIPSRFANGLGFNQSRYAAQAVSLLKFQSLNENSVSTVMFSIHTAWEILKFNESVFESFWYLHGPACSVCSDEAMLYSDEGELRYFLPLFLQMLR